MIKETISSNIDGAMFSQLFRFHLVVSVFAFRHISLNVPVAVFIIYVFAATSVLRKGWSSGSLYHIEGKTWENVRKCALPAPNAWCLLKYWTRWHSVKLLSGVITHNESQLHQSGFHSCKHASYICFPISAADTKSRWRNGCLPVFGVVERTLYIIRR